MQWLVRGFYIAVEAAAEMLSKRSVLGLALLPPSAAFVVLTVLENRLPEFAGQAFIFGMAELVVSVPFAVACHRVLIAGPGSLHSRWGMPWSIRETRFLGWVVLVGVISVFASVVMSFLLLPFIAGSDTVSWQVIPVGIVMFYLNARLGLVLPATAVDQETNLRGSWALSSGNGLSITVALLIPAVAYLAVMAFAAIPREPPGLPESVLITVIGIALLAWEVGVLSIAFKALSSVDSGEDLA